jgi:hypothetical protein
MSKPNRFNEFVKFMDGLDALLSPDFRSLVISKLQVAMGDAYDRGVIEGKQIAQTQAKNRARLDGENLTAKAEDILDRLVRYRPVSTTKPHRPSQAIYEQDRDYLARELARAREIVLDEVAQAAAGEDI